MSNLTSKTIELTEPSTKVLPKDATVPKKNGTNSLLEFNRLRTLITSQKARLQSLSVLVIINFVTSGLGFLTMVKVANVMGKENFGELVYALALGAYGAMIVRYGFNRTLIRDLTHYPERFGSLVFASLTLRMFLLGLVLGGLVIWKVFANEADGLSWAVIIIVIGTTLRSLDLQAVYDTWHQFRRHAIYNLIQRCLYFVVIWSIVLICPERLALLWIGTATICSIILYLILQHRWAMKKIDRTTIDLSLLPTTVLLMLKKNIWIWLAAIAVLSFSSLNQILLKHFKGASELGGYAAAWQIVVIAQMLLLNIARIGNPATARITRKGIDNRMRIHFLLKYSGVMLLTVMPICVLALICPTLILSTIFRPEYVSVAPILRVLALYVILFSVGLVAAQYLISNRMENIYFVNTLVGGVLSFLLYSVLIPRFAGFGAALALLISIGLSISLNSIAVIKHVRSQRTNY